MLLLNCIGIIILRILREHMPHKQMMKNENIQLLIDTYDGAMIVINTKGVILALNNTLAAIIGKTKNELIGTPASMHLKSICSESGLKLLQQILYTKEPAIWEDFKRNRWWKKRAIPILDSAGNVTKIIGYITDITEEKKAHDNKLKQKENLYYNLISNVSDIIVLINEKGNIIFNSVSLEKFLGYKQKARIGGSIFDNLHPDELERAKKLLKKIVEIPGPHLGNVFKIRHKNGSWRLFDVHANNLLHDENINGIIVTLRDITEQKIIEQELKETKEYLRNIIDNTNEIIFTIKRENKVTLWNRSAERLTGFKNKQQKDFSRSEFGFIENFKDTADFINQIFSHKNRTLEQIILKNKTGSSHILKPSVSVLKDNKGSISDIIFICKDITYESELHEQILPGSSYMIESGDNTDMKRLLKNYVNKGKNELFITREPVEIESHYIESNQTTIMVFTSLKDAKFASITNPDDFKRSIVHFIDNTSDPVIIIDRIDYLINIHGFKKIFPVLCEMNDVIKKHQALLFIRINKLLLSEIEYLSLKEEYTAYPSKYLEDVYLEAVLFEILEFVGQENKWNKIVNQNKIVNRFTISKLTAQKRIAALLDAGLLLSKVKGRSKQLYITDKGKELLEKKKIP